MERSITTEEYGRLLAVLRELRMAAGLRQEDVAEALDVNQTWVSKYERGERRLDVVELAQVAKVLGSSLTEVILRLDLD
ncbi:MAG TPA: helix-turn-helix transcriptional regulator [Jiangellaceae bacterium]